MNAKNMVVSPIFKSALLVILMMAIIACSGQSSSADIALNNVNFSPPTDLSAGEAGTIAFQIDAEISAEVDGCAVTESSDCLIGTSYAFLTCRMAIAPVSLPDATTDYEFTSEQYGIERANDDTWEIDVASGYLNSHSSGNGTVNDCLAAGEIGFQANVAGEYTFRVTTDLSLRTSFGFGEESGASDEESATQDIVIVVQ